MLILGVLAVGVPVVGVPVASMPAAGMQVVRAFLFNTFLAVFAFSIVKIAMQGQQLCQTSCTYLV